MMVGGIAALLTQMLHPKALGGVWDHSDVAGDQIGRLRRGTARSSPSRASVIAIPHGRDRQGQNDPRAGQWHASRWYGVSGDGPRPAGLGPCRRSGQLPRRLEALRRASHELARTRTNISPRAAKLRGCSMRIGCRGRGWRPRRSTLTEFRNELRSDDRCAPSGTWCCTRPHPQLAKLQSGPC